MSSPPLTAVCPLCFRDVPRLDADPDGGWEKCEHCNGIFLVIVRHAERPDETRINIAKERDRLAVGSQPRTSLLWRGFLCCMTVELSIHVIVGVVAVFGLTNIPGMTGQFFVPLFFGWLTYFLIKSLLREENCYRSAVFDGDSVCFRWGPFPFAQRTERIPTNRIVGLESKPISGKNPEGERILLFHYLSSRHRKRLFILYPKSPAEERWVLDNLHDFLKTTVHGSPILPFAHLAPHPSEALSVKAVGDTMFVRIYCPRCGMRMMVTDLDLASGEAVCRQKNCGEHFVWWETPPQPAADPEEIKKLRKLYESYSDVRAFHFTEGADPFTATFELRRPFVPANMLRQPRRRYVSRPSMTLQNGQLTVRVFGTKPFDTLHVIGLLILSGTFLCTILLMLFMFLFPFLLMIAGEWKLSDVPTSLGMMGGSLLIFGLPSYWLYRLLINSCSDHCGRWVLTVNQAFLHYQRRCLWNRWSLTVPLEKWTGFYVVTGRPNWLFQPPEGFADHLLRFDVGRMSCFFPFGSEEHRNWAAAEIVDYLAARGWNVGNGTVRRVE